MSPKLNRHHPSQERDPRDAAERWLDFGRWLAGERTADEPAAADFSRPVPSFAGIAERHFRDLVPYAEHGNSLELRRAMHRRFIQALHLAFGPETLNDLAVHQPLHVFRLIEHLRADFDLLAEQPDQAPAFGRFSPEPRFSPQRGDTPVFFRRAG
jgi:hypothetical protein